MSQPEAFCDGFGKISPQKLEGKNFLLHVAAVVALHRVHKYTVRSRHFGGIFVQLAANVINVENG
jgi:hypothetical protein